MCACSGASAVSDSWPPCGLKHVRLLCPWDSPDMKTGVGCHALLQGIFLTQGSNLHLLHCKWIFNPLRHICVYTYITELFCVHLKHVSKLYFSILSSMKTKEEEERVRDLPLPCHHVRGHNEKETKPESANQKLNLNCIQNREK